MGNSESKTNSSAETPNDNVREDETPRTGNGVCTVNNSQSTTDGNAVEETTSDETEVQKPTHDIPEISWNYSWLNLISLKLKGLRFFTQNMKETESSVYKAYLFSDQVIVCDLVAMKTLYDYSLVRKLTDFGVLRFNTGILPGNIPCLFSNGEERLRKKRKILQFMSKFTTPRTMESLLTLIPVELRTVEEKTSERNERNFEASLFEFTANILNMLFFGEKISYEQMEAWAEGVAVPTFMRPPDNRKFLDAYEYLFNAISHSVSAKEFFESNETPEGEREEFVQELIFALVLNTYSAIKFLLVSSVVCMNKLSADDRNILVEEAKTFLSGEKSVHAFDGLTYIDGFVLEVLRLFPPAANVFRKANDSFILKSSCGSFQIPKDQMFQGKLQVAMRDPSVFLNPDEINIRRYEESPYLKTLVMSFGGDYDIRATEDNYKCPGQTFSYDVLKMVVVHLLFCDIEFSEPPEWSGKDLARPCASDKPLRALKFTYRV